MTKRVIRYDMEAAAEDMYLALIAVQGSYCLSIGSADETPDMKRARTLVGQAIDKVEGRSAKGARDTW